MGAVEESVANLGGEDVYGLGGISMDSMRSFNISITLLIEGRFEGYACMHHKPTRIISLSSFFLVLPRFDHESNQIKTFNCRRTNFAGTSTGWPGPGSQG